MDAETLSIIIIIIIIALLIISVAIFGIGSGMLLGDAVISYRNKQKTKKFNPLLNKLLEQNASTIDAIDLYKSIFDISDRNTPEFVSKIIISFEDFKTWKLEEEIKFELGQSNPSQPHEWRNKINQMIGEINGRYPFADLKSENKIFFEDFKKFIENREFEACKAKLVDLSKIFAAQNKDLETMAKRTRNAYYISIIGIVIGVFGIIFSIL